MKRSLRFGCALAMAGLLAGAAMGQTASTSSTAVNPLAGPASSTPASATFLQQMTDPLTVSAGAYVLSQVAAGAEAWKFTLSGKTYTVSAAQQTGITAASVVAAAAIAHKWPKWKLPLTIVLAGASAYYGGMAYANSLQHGTAATTAATSTATPAFRMGR